MKELGREKEKGERERESCTVFKREGEKKRGKKESCKVGERGRRIKRERDRER